MGFLIGIGVRFGAAAGWAGGLFVGLVAALIGGVLTRSLPDFALFLADSSLALGIVLPVLFYRSVQAAAQNPEFRALVPRQADLNVIAAVGWLSALGVGIIFYMMPVTMAPILLNKGVTWAGISDWYREVWLPILSWRLPVAAILSGVFTWIISRRVHTNFKRT